MRRGSSPNRLKRIDAGLRNDPEANRLFLEILTSRNAPEIVLRRMNEAGVLGRFIPDFGRIVGMMQFSMYHHYTVDEHLLRTVGVLAQYRGRTVDRGSPARRAKSCRRSPTARSSMSPLSCTTSPRAGRRIIRSPGRRSRASSARASAFRPPRPRRVAWLDRAASGHVDHRAKPRPLRPAHDGDVRRRWCRRSSGSRCC